MDSFKQKLKMGEDAEDVFYRLMMTKCQPEIKDFKLKKDDEVKAELRWDQVIYLKDGRVISFEVKFDKKSEETGNLAIEYASFGTWDNYDRSIFKASGLAATESDYWVHVVWTDKGWRHFYAPVSKLREAMLWEGRMGLTPNMAGKRHYYDRVATNEKAHMCDGDPLVGILLMSREYVDKAPWRCLEDVKDKSWDFLEVVER